MIYPTVDQLAFKRHDLRFCNMRPERHILAPVSVSSARDAAAALWLPAQ